MIVMCFVNINIPNNLSRVYYSASTVQLLSIDYEYMSI